MERIGLGTVLFEGILEPTLRAINKEWNPGGLENERKYRDSLATFLRAKVPDAHVETEYRHCGTTADLFFQWTGFGVTRPDELYVELKFNFCEKNECDRLIGQIEQLAPKSRHILVILCGNGSNPGFVSRIRQRYKGKEFDGWNDGSVTVLEKG
jgi:hypothetical protein